jgi:hypothetical protein
MNIIPKHSGQATVARRALQNRHCGASVETAAPHIGQFNDSGFMPKSSQVKSTVGEKISADAMTGCPLHGNELILYLTSAESANDFHPLDTKGTNRQSFGKSSAASLFLLKKKPVQYLDHEVL